MILCSSAAAVQRRPVDALGAHVGRAMVAGRSWWPFRTGAVRLAFSFRVELHSERGYQEHYWHLKPSTEVGKNNNVLIKKHFRKIDHCY